MVKRGKKEKEMFMFEEEKMGVDKESCVVIED